MAITITISIGTIRQPLRLLDTRDATLPVKEVKSGDKTSGILGSEISFSCFARSTEISTINVYSARAWSTIMAQLINCCECKIGRWGNLERSLFEHIATVILPRNQHGKQDISLLWPYMSNMSVVFACKFNVQEVASRAYLHNMHRKELKANEHPNI